MPKRSRSEPINKAYNNPSRLSDAQWNLLHWYALMGKRGYDLGLANGNEKTLHTLKRRGLVKQIKPPKEAEGDTCHVITNSGRSVVYFHLLKHRPVAGEWTP